MRISMISQETLHILASQKEGPMVTICLPLHHEGLRADENVRRLHAALASVEQELPAHGLSPKGAVQFLGVAKEYADETLNKPQGGNTLVVFLSPSLFQTYILPATLPETAVVGTHFSLAPLLPFLHKHASFLVLPFSKQHARLLHFSEKGMQEVAVDGMPQSFAGAMTGTELEKTKSQTGAKDNKKELLKEYVHAVAKALDASLQGHHEPLFFLGIDEEWGMFKKACAYPQLQKTVIAGNPDELSVEDIKTKGVALMAPLWQKEKDVVSEAYGALAGTGRTSTETQTVLDLAVQGKVDTLLVAENMAQWAAVQADTNIATLHDRYEAGDQELLGLAAAHTLQHKGWVQTLPQERMPEGKIIAAVLRY